MQKAVAGLGNFMRSSVLEGAYLKMQFVFACFKDK